MTTSHEVAEAVTDPDGDGWYDGFIYGEDEIADLCLTSHQLTIPELADRSYFVESLWSNAVGACVSQKAFESSDLLMRNASYEYVWKVPNGGYYAASGVFVSDSNWAIQGVGDVNADGVSDIVWRHSSGLVHIWFMRNGTLWYGVDVDTATSSWTLVGVGDVDGDGVSDLVWHNAVTNEIHVWQLNVSGAVARYINLGVPPTGFVFRGLGDFNHDGKADLLFTSTSGGVQHLGIWLMNGANILAAMFPGSNQINFLNGVEATVPTNRTFSGIGDFDADGISDPIWTNTTQHVTYVKFQTLSCPNSAPVCVSSNSVAVPNTGGALPSGYTIAAIGDSDANGTSDLFLHHSNGDVITWLVHPDATVSAVHTGSATTDYVMKGTGYFGFYPGVW